MDNPYYYIDRLYNKEQVMNEEDKTMMKIFNALTQRDRQVALISLRAMLIAEEGIRQQYGLEREPPKQTA
jgi:hypothetical protein